MNLKKIIVNCNEYEDDDDFVNIVFAEKIKNKFNAESNAKVLEIQTEELESLKPNELAQKYCEGYEYFLEIFVLQEFYNDLSENKEYDSDSKKIERVIYYAENDA